MNGRSLPGDKRLTYQVSVSCAGRLPHVKHTSGRSPHVKHTSLKTSSCRVEHCDQACVCFFCFFFYRSSVSEAPICVI